MIQWLHSSAKLFQLDLRVEMAGQADRQRGNGNLEWRAFPIRMPHDSTGDDDWDNLEAHRIQGSQGGTAQ
jgi:hypothetical protein